MEVYAFGFRNQSGVAFGPKGTKWENALAVSDNGANDLGHRRIANGPEKLFIVTEMGQDAGYPDKEGLRLRHQQALRLGVLPRQPRRSAASAASISARSRSSRRCSPTGSRRTSQGVRGVPLIAANPNPDGYINPVLEWDTNNPIDGIAWSAQGFGADNNLFGAVYGILDTGPESLGPDLAGGAARRIPGAGRRQMVGVRPQHRARAERLPEAGEPRRPGAAERRRLQQ